MKTTILVAVRMKHRRGRKEYMRVSETKVEAGVETWPPASEWPTINDRMQWGGFDGTGWDNGPA